MTDDKFDIFKNISTLNSNSPFGFNYCMDENEKVHEMIKSTLSDVFTAQDKKSVPHYYYKFGCSKAVVICNESPMVLKIPFNGEWMIINSEKQFLYYNHANTNEQNCKPWDYCEVEKTIYDNAVEDGFGNFFAKVDYYGETLSGYPLYLQERCSFKTQGSYSEVSSKITVQKNFWASYSKKRWSDQEMESKDIVKEEFWTLHSKGELFCSPLWGCAFVEQYGADMLSKLNEYIQKKCICDLHDANLGYRISDGAPVITDSSGFFD